MPAVAPQIRLFTLIVFSVCVALATGFAALGVAACMLVIAWVIRRTGPTVTAWRLLRRAKWLLVSLAVAYLAFVPGAPLLPGVFDNVPSIEGVQQVLLRAGAIVLLIFAVDVALFGLPSEQTLVAFYRLIRPWGWLGFSPERVALRGWLTLRFVGDGTASVVDPRPPRQVNSVRVTLSEGADLAAVKLKHALTPDLRDTLPITIELGSSAPVWQWVLPLGLVILFSWVSSL